MSKEKLTRLDIDVAKLFICEDEEYKLHLCRQRLPEEIYVVHLYRVSFFHEPREEIFVLAPSEAEAISQTTCLNGRDESHATALQMKVMIRGWSRNVF